MNKNKIVLSILFWAMYAGYIVVGGWGMSWLIRRHLEGN